MLSASQPPLSSQKKLPEIFVYNDGAQLKVFVESNGVSENRPRLMKTLRHHGAQICHDIAEATFILVEPDSPQGRQFVRDWGSDADKVVLSVSWVRKCVDAGRALLDEDNWGGCGDLDGTPLAEDGYDEDDKPAPRKRAPRASQASTIPRVAPSSVEIPDASRSSLPTPRSTPMGHAKASETADHHSLPRPGSVVGNSQQLPSPIVTSSGQPSHSVLPVGHDARAQATQHPYQFTPQYNQLVPAQQNALTVARPPPPNSAEAMAAYIAEHPEFMGILFREIAQRNNSYAPVWPQDTQFSPQSAFFQGGVSQGPPMRFPFPTHNMNGSQATMHSPYEQTASPQFPPPAPYQVEEVASSQPSSSTPESVSTLRHISPEPSSRSVHRSGIHASSGKRRLHEVLDRTARSSSPSTSQLDAGDRQNEVKKQRMSPVIKKRPIGIFTKDDGETPSNFFIQVQVRNRIDLVKQVRKNGGQICFEPSDADFIILVPQQDKMSEQWMRSVIDLGRYALRPAFIEACIKEGDLVDEEEFKIGEGKGKGKGSNRKGKPRRKDTGHSVERESKSPPLPPPPDRLPRYFGRAIYSAEDREYALAYARHAFKYRPSLSLTALAAELGKRVPLHNVTSWTTYTQTYAVDFERIRTEVASSKTNTRSKSVESEDTEVENLIPNAVEANGTAKTENEGTLANGVRNIALDGWNTLSSQVPTSPKQTENDLEADFKTIVNYFANPPAGVEGDDQLWADLAKEYKCLTAASWQDFYQKHNDDVNNRLIAVLDLNND